MQHFPKYIFSCCISLFCPSVSGESIYVSRDVKSFTKEKHTWYGLILKEIKHISQSLPKNAPQQLTKSQQLTGFIHFSPKHLWVPWTQQKLTSSHHLGSDLHQVSFGTSEHSRAYSYGDGRSQEEETHLCKHTWGLSSFFNWVNYLFIVAL